MSGAGGAGGQAAFRQAAWWHLNRRRQQAPTDLRPPRVGAPRSPIAVGERFGDLVVERLIGVREPRQDRLWQLRCSCGRTALRTTAVLVQSRKWNRELACGDCFAEMRRGIFATRADSRLERIRSNFLAGYGLYSAFDEEAMEADVLAALEADLGPAVERLPALPIVWDNHGQAGPPAWQWQVYSVDDDGDDEPIEVARPTGDDEIRAAIFEQRRSDCMRRFGVPWNAAGSNADAFIVTETPPQRVVTQPESKVDEALARTKEKQKIEREHAEEMSRFPLHHGALGKPAPKPRGSAERSSAKPFRSAECPLIETRDEANQPPLLVRARSNATYESIVLDLMNVQGRDWTRDRVACGLIAIFPDGHWIAWHMRRAVNRQLGVLHLRIDGDREVG